MTTSSLPPPSLSSTYDHHPISLSVLVLVLILGFWCIHLQLVICNPNPVCPSHPRPYVLFFLFSSFFFLLSPSASYFFNSELRTRSPQSPQTRLGTALKNTVRHINLLQPPSTFNTPTIQHSTNRNPEDFYRSTLEAWCLLPFPSFSFPAITPLLLNHLFISSFPLTGRFLLLFT